MERIPEGSKGILRDALRFLISKSAVGLPRAGEYRNHLGQKFLTWRSWNPQDDQLEESLNLLKILVKVRVWVYVGMKTVLRW